MAIQRKHEITINVTFDKPVTRTQAVFLVQEELEDQNFYIGYEQIAAKEFSIHNAKITPKPKKD